VGVHRAAIGITACEGTIYLDKVSKFACEVIQRTNGLPLPRFEQIFDRLFTDESQDLAGSDLDLVEHLLHCRTEIVLVGDNRQATYTTNDSRRNMRYARTQIVDKFHEWEEKGLCSVRYETHSHRCIQAICDFADQFFPTFAKTNSLNADIADHDGIFVVETSNVPAYVARFQPQTLRYNRTYNVVPGPALNFGGAKGMTFERVLIVPHGPLNKFLLTGNLADAGKKLPKIYVAITRARQSVGFVVPDGFVAKVLPLYKPEYADALT
jgi:DNA helicase-2/ATP-dependent DNA helicase PcrA